MKDFSIDQTQRFAVPLVEVFAFFANPANLARITPDWIRFEIRSRQPVEMQVGVLIDYSIRLHGLPLKWRSEITAWEPPFRFVDEQRIGPYRYWIHEHTFAEHDDDTTVTDRVRYAVPGGALVQRLFVARDISRIFAYRRSVLAGIFDEIAVDRPLAVR